MVLRNSAAIRGLRGIPLHIMQRPTVRGGHKGGLEQRNGVWKWSGKKKNRKIHWSSWSYGRSQNIGLPKDFGNWKLWGKTPSNGSVHHHFPLKKCHVMVYSHLQTHPKIMVNNKKQHGFWLIPISNFRCVQRFFSDVWSITSNLKVLKNH